MRLTLDDESALVLDGTATTLGASSVRAGAIFLQLDETESGDGAALGSHAQWLLEPA